MHDARKAGTEPVTAEAIPDHAPRGQLPNSPSQPIVQDLPTLNLHFQTSEEGSIYDSDTDPGLGDLLKDIVPSWSTDGSPNRHPSNGANLTTAPIEEILDVGHTAHQYGSSFSLHPPTLGNANLGPTLLAPIPCRVELPAILGVGNGAKEHCHQPSAFQRPSSAQSRIAALQQEIVDLQIRIKELEASIAHKPLEAHNPSDTMDPAVKVMALEQVLLALDSQLGTISDNQRDTKVALTAIVQFLDWQSQRPAASALACTGKLAKLTSPTEATLVEQEVQYDQWTQPVRTTRMKTSAGIANLQAQLGQALCAKQQVEAQLQHTLGVAQALQQANRQLTLTLDETRQAYVNREMAWNHSMATLTSGSVSGTRSSHLGSNPGNVGNF
ncbi:hypothetical protein H4R34_000633 [Dimargaris verticillata]|uniref:Uncharacterized protein n=1 Tax=Dimargaris verticillata TaxID=2761393 RepID=A0A9W8BA16_9FUNG|nr:hypothetical protein H4R34_000633 [Dimargaris verticillata]